MPVWDRPELKQLGRSMRVTMSSACQWHIHPPTQVHSALGGDPKRAHLTDHKAGLVGDDTKGPEMEILQLAAWPWRPAFTLIAFQVQDDLNFVATTNKTPKAQKCVVRCRGVEATQTFKPDCLRPNLCSDIVAGWMVASPKKYVHLEPVNVSLFGKRVFMVVMKWKILRWDPPGLGWALNPIVSVFIKRRGEDIGGRWCCVGRGRDWSHVSTSREIPRNASSYHKPGERQGTDSPSEPLEEANPPDTWLWTSGLQSYETMNFLSFKVIRFVVICHGSLRKLTQTSAFTELSDLVEVTWHLYTSVSPVTKEISIIP